MSYFRAAVFAALAVFAGGAPALANDITLTSKDGAVEINGTLLGFDGEFYRVDTLYGELTVDGTGVTCDGPGCPNLLDYVAEVTISGAASMADVLMPAPDRSLRPAQQLHSGPQKSRVGQFHL